jgi:hypothetical protein
MIDYHSWTINDSPKSGYLPIGGCVLAMFLEKIRLIEWSSHVVLSTNRREEISEAEIPM